MLIDDVLVPCPLLHLGLQEAFYTSVLHILYINRVMIPLVDLVLVHLDVGIRRD